MQFYLNHKEEKFMLDALSTEDLFELCLNNHRAAWEEFFRRYIPLIKSSIKKTLGYELGKDIEKVSEIYVQVVEKLYSQGKLRDCNNPARIEPWLWEIARNQAIDWLIARKRIKRMPEVQSEIAMLSLDGPASNNSEITLAELIHANKDACDALQDSKVQYTLFKEKIFSSLAKIQNLKYRWCLRLSLLGMEPLTEREIAKLAEFISLSRKEIKARIDHIMIHMAQKEKRKAEAEEKAVLYWYIIDKMERNLRDLETFHKSIKQQEIIILREKIEAKKQQRSKMLASSKRLIRPTNKEIAMLIGIPENQSQQITNILKRAKNEFIKAFEAV